MPRIKTRILVSADRGAQETAVWEQWIDQGGYIPLHYHEVEEVLVFLSGQVDMTLDGETTLVSAPATAVIPARKIHGLRQAGPAQVHLLAMFPTAQPTIIAADGSLRPMPWDDHDGGAPP